MNKQEFIAAVAERTQMTKKDVEAVLNAVLDEITEALKRGERVQFVGFGTFETRKREARTGRNPQTGEEIRIAASVVPVFKAGNKLKEAVKA
ncbi:HU family DNA-binding protein [Hydrogenibacillus schlegelii]|uniref:DNA-binding protein n=1 Tax=Hydrogenibacillus schlegelii TaxID=1484 RepID=A0A132N1A6_HYDSH|nr:HU family DNA-binding protein [Hydrogenibacillus schlegelii]KWX03918.1 DNA-binding protein [Hydrogenibacillus schlegelii]MBE3563440.1 HU family DNA-binding protein [Hydrogenibacillus schlegelii]MBT9282040.1 HU family DNA-binding protein [Hydrogenibacillus schlegelii]OAR04107.1 DNA-binding protein [Hydrogenibacillus schlegelii]PTQ53046.1 MAG: DNA-binding protein [Hydrogenibacillus schlegelii]